MHMVCLKQRFTTPDQGGMASLRYIYISNIIIINFLLHNYYGNSPDLYCMYYL